MKKKKIGQGAFTKAYLREDNQVLLVSRCPIKEAMALGWFPNVSLFPKIERIKIVGDGTSHYLMEYLPRPRSLKNNLKPSQWQIYNDLKALNPPIRFVSRDSEMFDKWYNAFCTLKNRSLSNIMLEALNACANYGRDIGFEISPRNVSVKKGKLILLDCFYQYSKMW